MAISKIKLPDNSTQDIHDSRVLGVDSTPTANSSNLVTSGGVYATLANKADDSDVVHVTGDETIEGDKKFFDDVIVSNRAQGTDGEATIELQASSSSIAANKYYSAETAEDFSWVNWSGTYSPWPPGPGAEPVTHTKTLQQALDERNNPTIDSTPTSGSTNPVSSGGVYTALGAKQGTISDLATIRSGAAAGATAYQKPSTGIPASDLASGVIPTYDLSQYETKTNKVTSLSSASTDTQYPSAKCVYDLIGDVETLINAL